MSVGLGGGEAGKAGSPATPFGLPNGVEKSQAQYASLLQAWFLKHKRYPHPARSRRQQGSVKVWFRVDSQGNILERRIDTGSGFSILDKATLDLLDRALPVPTPPQIRQATDLTFTVPIAYSLNEAVAMRIAALVALVAGCQTAFMTHETKTSCPRNLKSPAGRRSSAGLSTWLTASLLLWVTGCVHTDRPQRPAGTITQVAGQVKPDEPTPRDISSPEAAEPQRDALVDAIARLSEHGLDPEAYGLSQILDLSDDPNAQAKASRDAWRLAATHLAYGVLDPKTLHRRRVAEIADNAMLMQIDAQGGPGALASALDRLAPQHPEYLALKAELARQQAAMAQEADPTARASHAALIDQLRVNLERWRWLPQTLGPRYVIANIPGFDVTAMALDAVQARHAAIFGAMNRETPTFSDSIEYIIFNPWWDVPDSIARADKLPQFRRDPGIIGRLGYKIFDRQGQVIDPSGINWADVKASSFPYRIRQAPGPANALGQVKIMFPNPYNVYLHDTSDRGLFDADQRTFSSGCVRVKEPLDLAAWLLEDTPGWDRAHIDAAVAARKETRANMLAPVPIYIVYFTAVDDSCGGVRYLTDIYGRDVTILAALKEPVLR